MATAINTMEIPVSTVQSATAASYTVPADRYAIVRAGVHRGGTFSINGTVVLFSEDLSWSAQAVNNSPFTYSLAAGSGGSLTSTSTTPTGGSAAYTNATARAFSSPHETTFKVPPGTVIVGSGTARYHVELYRVPGSAT